jgi:hypothetical protein
MVAVLMELGLPDPVPALMLQRSRTSCNMASGVVRRLVSHRLVRLVDRDKWVA